VLAGRSQRSCRRFFFTPCANATFFALFTPGNVPFVSIYAQKGATFAPKIFEGLNVTRVFFGAATRRGATVSIFTQKPRVVPRTANSLNLLLAITYVAPCTPVNLFGLIKYVRWIGWKKGTQRMNANRRLRIPNHSFLIANLPIRNRSKLIAFNGNLNSNRQKKGIF